MRNLLFLLKNVESKNYLFYEHMASMKVWLSFWATFSIREPQSILFRKKMLTSKIIDEN